MGEPMWFDRTVLLDVLIYHQRTSSLGCACGWGELGRSHAEHVIDVFEASMAARRSSRRPEGGQS